MAIKSHPACSLNDHLQGESQDPRNNTSIAVHWQGSRRMATSCLWWWLRGAAEARPLQASAPCSPVWCPPISNRCEHHVLSLSPRCAWAWAWGTVKPVGRGVHLSRRCAAGGGNSGGQCRGRRHQLLQGVGSHEPQRECQRHKRSYLQAARRPLCCRKERESCGLNTWCRTHLGAAHQLAAHRQLIDGAA